MRQQRLDGRIRGDVIAAHQRMHLRVRLGQQQQLLHPRRGLVLRGGDIRRAEAHMTQPLIAARNVQNFQLQPLG